MGSWWRVRVEAPAELEDELVGRLFAAGSQGSWTEPSGPGRIALHAFFTAADRRSSPAALDLGALASVSVSAPEWIEERDWLADWRAVAEPIPLGERFVVDPREPALAAAAAEAAGRFLLRLPARTAFGVGSHESTRLAVELLETLPVAGRSVLDVGTGTGILAFAALRLGARRVVACDVDPAAALLLPQYMTLNGMLISAFAGTLAALEPPAGGFDLALVNVVPAEIAPDLARLADCLAPAGRAVFSGILAAQAEAALAALRRHGLRERARRVAGEWLALVTEPGR